jgi:hypothetical protein
VNQFLKHIFDTPMSVLEVHYFPYILQMCKEGQFSKQDIGAGLSTYLSNYPDNIIDLPILKSYMP